MSSEKASVRRGTLEAEIRQIIDHDGPLDSGMVDSLERLEAEVREIDQAERAEQARTNAAALLAEPRRVAPSFGSVERANQDAAWEGYLRWWRSNGQDRSGLEARDLTTVGATSSAAIPTVLQPELIRKMAAASGTRSAVDVRQYPDGVEVPIVDARVSVTAITGESAPIDEDDVEFTKASFDATSTKSAAVVSEISVQFMADARIDTIREVALNHAEELGRFWSSKYTNGLDSGGGTPTIWTDPVFDDAGDYVPAANVRTAASTSAVTAANLIDLRYGALPAEYWNYGGGLVWIMSQTVFSSIMSLTETGGRPLFQPAAQATLGDTLQGTLLGLPVYIEASAPSPGTGNIACVLMARNAYRVADRLPGITTQINPYAKMSSGLTQVVSMHRSCGRWLRPEAAAILKYA